MSQSPPASQSKPIRPTFREVRTSQDFYYEMKYGDFAYSLEPSFYLVSSNPTRPGALELIAKGCFKCHSLDHQIGDVDCRAGPFPTCTKCGRLGFPRSNCQSYKWF